MSSARLLCTSFTFCNQWLSQYETLISSKHHPVDLPNWVNQRWSTETHSRERLRAFSIHGFATVHRGGIDIAYLIGFLWSWHLFTQPSLPLFSVLWEKEWFSYIEKCTCMSSNPLCWSPTRPVVLEPLVRCFACWWTKCGDVLLPFGQLSIGDAFVFQ